MKNSQRGTRKYLRVEFNTIAAVLGRESVKKGLLWTSMIAATLCIVASLAVDSSALGASCSSAACSYFDAKDQAHAGTCGSKKGDDKHCYCFNKDDNKLSQEQSGCSSK